MENMLKCQEMMRMRMQQEICYKKMEHSEQLIKRKL